MSKQYYTQAGVALTTEQWQVRCRLGAPCEKMEERREGAVALFRVGYSACNAGW